MTQWLGSLVVLPEVPGSVPGTYRPAHSVCNSSYNGSDTHFWPLKALHIHGAQTFTQTEHSITQK